MIVEYMYEYLATNLCVLCGVVGIVVVGNYVRCNSLRGILCEQTGGMVVLHFDTPESEASDLFAINVINENYTEMEARSEQGVDISMRKIQFGGPSRKTRLEMAESE